MRGNKVGKKKNSMSYQLWFIICQIRSLLQQTFSFQQQRSNVGHLLLQFIFVSLAFQSLCFSHYPTCQWEFTICFCTGWIYGSDAIHFIWFVHFSERTVLSFYYYLVVKRKHLTNQIQNSHRTKVTEKHLKTRKVEITAEVGQFL